MQQQLEDRRLPEHPGQTAFAAGIECILWCVPFLLHHYEQQTPILFNTSAPKATDGQGSQS